MKVIRDRVTGETVTWYDDPDVGIVIRGSSEMLAHTTMTVTDLAAGAYYTNNPKTKRDGFSSIHPYDRDRIAMLQAELVVLQAWHRAGGNY
jgi:hypothetical protein